MVNREDIFGSIRAQDVKGIAIRMLNKLLPSLNNLPSDLFFPQNFPSLFCSRVVDPSRSDWVLDMCAAPGGKAGHLAYLMKTNSKESDPHCGGKLIAIDRTKSKIDKVCCFFFIMVLLRPEGDFFETFCRHIFQFIIFVATLTFTQ